MSNPSASPLQAPTPSTQAALGTQGDAEGEEEEEDAAEGADDEGEGDDDEDLSPLVCIIWDWWALLKVNSIGLYSQKRWGNCGPIAREVSSRKLSCPPRQALCSSPPHSQAPLRPWDG